MSLKRYLLLGAIGAGSLALLDAAAHAVGFHPSRWLSRR